MRVTTMGIMRIMKELPIPRRVKKAWDAWDLKVCISGSLGVQLALAVLAPLRQRWKNAFLRVVVWTAYLLADWVAAVAIGTITKTLGDVGRLPGNDNLCALWSAFLLLHLGGPDSITSFSLEDNELWLRNFFTLLLQVASAAYSLYLTIPDNNLWLPSLLILVAGTIKFSERTRALYLASLDHFGSTVLPDPNPGPDYEEAAVTTTHSTLSTSQSEKVTTTATDRATSYASSMSDLKLLEVAYARFESFKGLIVGFVVSSKDRESSRTYFLKEDAITAFRLVEFELSFMYQALHTKAVVLHSFSGYLLRFLSLAALVAAAAVFFSIEKPSGHYGDIELKLTYTLFAGAVALDAVSAFDIVFSDFVLMHRRHRRWLGRLIPRAISGRKRWCGEISQYDMVTHCIDGSRASNYDFFGTKELVNWAKIRIFSTSERVPDYLKEFIFAELKRKSSEAASSPATERGDAALRRMPESYAKLKWSVGELEYAESLLVWHIATELCRHEADDRSSHCGDGKAISKLVSNYMFYLLVMKPTMVAPVLGNWHVVFQDTFAESTRYFAKHGLSESFGVYEKTAAAAVKTKFVRAGDQVKGGASRSVLFEACVLAQQLRLESHGRWNVMSRVWVEMLCYAAVNCRSVVHAQQLSKGGELLTFTWFLMNHLGLGADHHPPDPAMGINK